MKGPSQAVLLFLAGIITAGAAAYFIVIQENQKHEDKIAELQKQIDQLQKQIPGQPERANAPGNSSGNSTIKAKPSKLADFIRTEQSKYVKESFGEEAYESFTQKDLDSFTKEKRPAQIVAELRHNNEFLDIVRAIKAMPPAERQRLLASSRELSHPTWRELGRISREGQTDAGQQAERMIAKAIVAEVERLLELSDDEIKKMYS
jgi:hypothetical protein